MNQISLSGKVNQKEPSGLTANEAQIHIYAKDYCLGGVPPPGIVHDRILFLNLFRASNGKQVLIPVSLSLDRRYRKAFQNKSLFSSH